MTREGEGRTNCLNQISYLKEGIVPTGIECSSLKQLEIRLIYLLSVDLAPSQLPHFDLICSSLKLAESNTHQISSNQFRFMIKLQTYIEDYIEMQ
jgi:hypothetical protein